MAVTQNTYTGNGSTVLYSFTFPYLETTDIKVSVNGTVTTAYTLANATTIQFNSAPANGAAIRIYRETDDSALAATFYPGSAIRSQDLNENFTQNLYVTQESTNNAATATTTANTALTNSNTAISTANSAVSTANTASSNASAAVATANTASSNASAAVSTANTASSNATTAVNTANAATATANSATSTANTALSTANAATSTANAASTAATNAVNTANAASSTASSAVSTANTASTNASNAVSTANSAVTTANNAVSTANSAVSTANSAVSTANAAASAVANAILYDIVANVAAIPGSPANNDAVEVTDSTGIESFTPLTGVPGGFTGNSGLSVRIVYTTTGNTWTWIQYFPNDPETRYLKLGGGTLTGSLGVTTGSAASPSVFISGDTNTGIYSPGADQLALSTNSTERVRITSDGQILIGKTSSFLPGDADLEVQKFAYSASGFGSYPYNNYGPIESITIVNGGSGYTDGSYTNIALRVNGSAVGVFANFVVSGGSITSAIPITDGRAESISVGSYMTLNDPSALGASGTGLELEVGSIRNAYFGVYATPARIRLGNSDTTVAADQELGAILFSNRDSGGAFAYSYAGDTARIYARAVGTNGGGYLDFWAANNSEMAASSMVVKRTGVGIGTTAAPSSSGIRLTVNDNATAGGIELSASNQGGGALVPTPTGGLQFYTYTGAVGSETYLERFRCDSSGRLLVGTSTSTGPLWDVTPQLQIEGNTSNTSSASFFRNSNDNDGPYIAFGKSRGTTTGASTIVSNNDSLGGIYFVGADGTDRNTPAAMIYAQVDGTPGANDMPGRLVFSTTADGASSPTERMRIPSGGGLSVGTTASPLAVNQQAAIRIGALNISQTTITNLSTTWTDITVSPGANGLAFIDIFNTSSGSQGNFLVSWRKFPANATVISSSNGTGLTINFQVSSGKLQMQTTSGTVSGAAFVFAG